MALRSSGVLQPVSSPTALSDSEFDMSLGAGTKENKTAVVGHFLYDLKTVALQQG